jgi:hypothetical protein
MSENNKNSAAHFHKKTDRVWKDAAGLQIPARFVTNAERSFELLSAKVLKSALHAEKTLLDLHVLMSECFEEVRALINQEMDSKKKPPLKQKSLTWFNFDKSVKIEAKSSDLIKWNESMLTEAMDLINIFLGKSMGDVNDLIRRLVADALSNRKKQVDARKIFQIIKHRDKIKNKDFQAACDLLIQAQGYDRSKIYMSVSFRKQDGVYQAVNLNFSNF